MNESPVAAFACTALSVVPATGLLGGLVLFVVVIIPVSRGAPI